MRIDAGLADVGVLLEPASIVAKAWEQIDRIGGQAFFAPKVAVITGAGPIGSGVRAEVMVGCTGVSSVVLESMKCGATDAMTCLTGVSRPGTKTPVDIGLVDRGTVLGNEVIFGSVNANRRHYAAAVKALGQADKGWLARLITRRVAMADFAESFTRCEDDVKVVLEMKGH